MSIRFATQIEYKDKRRDDLRETLDIQISDTAGIRSYEMYSGGEAFRVNFAIRLALEEALSNAFKHGNKNDPRKKVELACRVDAQMVEIDIMDEGEGFDPNSVPDPTAEENIEIPAGRGLTLIRAFMTEVEIHPPGNRVRMKYVRPA